MNYRNKFLFLNKQISFKNVVFQNFWKKNKQIVYIIRYKKIILYYNVKKKFHIFFLILCLKSNLKNFNVVLKDLKYKFRVKNFLNNSSFLHMYIK